ncbi:MAG: hypothetical protein DI603_07940 [Roseateles depolymerans]|uniref:PEP-CTERM protein-sorting domain-containing protein n=1 Tax=Roseateles depolymerans TaxID=76731 RepID=A0A2W5FK63_9BURK|nr:MAG: hypothetical protein DI603_07940 [Roseateles depolymerans]
MKHPVISWALTSTVLAAAHGAPLAATPVVTTTSGTTPFAVSGIDLLQTSLAGAPVVVGQFTGYGTGGEAVLRDGNAGGAQATDYTGTALVVSDSTVTYTLDLGVSPQGYNITAIETFGAWDDGRDQQQISISYATVADPEAFITLTAYGFDPIGDFSRVRVTPGSGDAFLMQNVYAIRFSFPNQENSASGYRELDVFGVSAVPEPQRWGLLAAGLGLIGLWARRGAAARRTT